MIALRQELTFPVTTPHLEGEHRGDDFAQGVPVADGSLPAPTMSRERTADTPSDRKTCCLLAFLGHAHRRFAQPALLIAWGVNPTAFDHAMRLSLPAFNNPTTFSTDCSLEVP